MFKNFLVSNASPYGDAVNAFGDSITVGQQASPSSLAYANLLTSAFNWTLNNQAVAGTQIQDWIHPIYTTSISDSHEASFVLPGYNDMRFFGDVNADQTYVSGCLEAELAWLAVPQSKKIISSNSSQVALTGTWAANTGYGPFIFSLTALSTATFQTTGSTLLLGMSTTTISGTFTVTIDGVVSTFTIGNTTNVSNNLGVNYGPRILRFSNLGVGTHTVVISLTSGRMYFDWATGFTPNLVNGYPLVLSGNCIKMPAASYAAGGNAPFINGSDAAVTDWNFYLKRAATNLQNDGLNVRYIDVSANYNPLSDVGADAIHPSNAGYQNIFNSFFGSVVGNA